jgi:hypothetical protein
MCAPWELISPKWTCGSLPARSAALYRQVIAQFDVEHAARYQPHGGATFCNIFAADCLDANGCGAFTSHWKLGREQTANDMADALTSSAAREHGWTLIDADHARRRALAGFPTVAFWRNPSGGPGHIAAVLPSSPEGPIRIAQAGARCFFDEPLEAGFGHLPVLFATHD